MNNNEAVKEESLPVERKAWIGAQRKDTPCDSWPACTQWARMAGGSGYTGGVRLDKRNLKARLRVWTSSSKEVSR